MKRLLRRRPSPALVIACLALLIALGPTAYASHVGLLDLGHSNPVGGAQTSLTGNRAGKLLQVTNSSTAAGSTALGLTVGAGRTPFTVNSSTKVANLNADKLDGLDSSAFGRTSGQTVAVPPGFNMQIGQAGSLVLFYSCSDPTSGNGALILWNNSGSVANVFVDSGGNNPLHIELSAGQQSVLPAALVDSFHIDAQGAASGISTIDVAIAHRTDDCLTQTLAVVAPS
jgi:hypothetical protein